MCEEELRKYCIICKGKINRASTKHSSKVKRKPKSVTCNPRCSKVYNGVRLHIVGKVRRYQLDKKKKQVEWFNERLENQLRIHWKWLKDKSYEEIFMFINSIHKKAFKDIKK